MAGEAGGPGGPLGKGPPQYEQIPMRGAPKPKAPPPNEYLDPDQDKVPGIAKRAAKKVGNVLKKPFGKREKGQPLEGPVEVQAPELVVAPDVQEVAGQAAGLGAIGEPEAGLGVVGAASTEFPPPLRPVRESLTDLSRRPGQGPEAWDRDNVDAGARAQMGRAARDFADDRARAGEPAGDLPPTAEIPQHEIQNGDELGKLVVDGKPVILDDNLDKADADAIAEAINGDDYPEEAYHLWVGQTDAPARIKEYIRGEAGLPVDESEQVEPVIGGRYVEPPAPAATSPAPGEWTRVRPGDDLRSPRAEPDQILRSQDEIPPSHKDNSIAGEDSAQGIRARGEKAMAEPLAQDDLLAVPEPPRFEDLAAGAKIKDKKDGKVYTVNSVKENPDGTRTVTFSGKTGRFNKSQTFNVPFTDSLFYGNFDIESLPPPPAKAGAGNEPTAKGRRLFGRGRRKPGEPAPSAAAPAAEDVQPADYWRIVTPDKVNANAVKLASGEDVDFKGATAFAVREVYGKAGIAAPSDEVIASLTGAEVAPAAPAATAEPPSEPVPPARPPSATPGYEPGKVPREPARLDAPLTREEIDRALRIQEKIDRGEVVPNYDRNLLEIYRESVSAGKEGFAGLEEPNDQSETEPEDGGPSIPIGPDQRYVSPEQLQDIASRLKGGENPDAIFKGMPESAVRFAYGEAGMPVPNREVLDSWAGAKPYPPVEPIAPAATAPEEPVPVRIPIPPEETGTPESFETVGSLKGKVFVTADGRELTVVDDRMEPGGRNVSFTSTTPGGKTATLDLPYEGLMLRMQPDEKTGRGPLYVLKSEAAPAGPANPPEPPEALAAAAPEPEPAPAATDNFDAPGSLVGKTFVKADGTEWTVDTDFVGKDGTRVMNFIDASGKTKTPLEAADSFLQEIGVGGTWTQKPEAPAAPEPAKPGDEGTPPAVTFENLAAGTRFTDAGGNEFTVDQVSDNPDGSKRVTFSGGKGKQRSTQLRELTREQFDSLFKIAPTPTEASAGGPPPAKAPARDPFARREEPAAAPEAPVERRLWTPPTDAAGAAISQDALLGEYRRVATENGIADADTMTDRQVIDAIANKGRSGALNPEGADLLDFATNQGRLYPPGTVTNLARRLATERGIPDADMLSHDLLLTDLGRLEAERLAASATAATAPAAGAPPAPRAGGAIDLSRLDLTGGAPPTPPVPPVAGPTPPRRESAIDMSQLEASATPPPPPRAPGAPPATPPPGGPPAPPRGPDVPPPSGAPLTDAEREALLSEVQATTGIDQNLLNAIADYDQEDFEAFLEDRKQEIANTRAFVTDIRYPADRRSAAAALLPELVRRRKAYERIYERTFNTKPPGEGGQARASASETFRAAVNQMAAEVGRINGLDAGGLKTEVDNLSGQVRFLTAQRDQHRVGSEEYKAFDANINTLGAMKSHASDLLQARQGVQSEEDLRAEEDAFDQEIQRYRSRNVEELRDDRQGLVDNIRTLTRRQGRQTDAAQKKATGDQIAAQRARLDELDSIMQGKVTENAEQKWLDESPSNQIDARLVNLKGNFRNGVLVPGGEGDLQRLQARLNRAPDADKPRIAQELLQLQTRIDKFEQALTAAKAREAKKQGITRVESVDTLKEVSGDEFDDYSDDQRSERINTIIRRLPGPGERLTVGGVEMQMRDVLMGAIGKVARGEKLSQLEQAAYIRYAADRFIDNDDKRGMLNDLQRGMVFVEYPWLKKVMADRIEASKAIQDLKASNPTRWNRFFGKFRKAHPGWFALLLMALSAATIASAGLAMTAIQPRHR